MDEEGIVNAWLSGFTTSADASKNTNESRKQHNVGLGFQQKKSEIRNLIHDQSLSKNKKTKTEHDLDTHGIVESDNLSRTLINNPPNIELQHSNSSDIVKNVDYSMSDTLAARDLKIKTKKTKTRSKQKNIRRDRRSANHKPSYLQFGSSDYKGRPLTKETKKIIGVEG